MREWTVVERDQPALAACSAADLLDRARELPGAQRYTRRANHVLLVNEQRPAPSPAHEGALTSEQVESVLETFGVEWARRDNSWAVLSAPREVRLTIVPAGVQLTAVLAEWDDIAPECSQALAEFLVRAQAALCFARCEIAPTQARIVSQAQRENLDLDLLDALHGVTAGCRRLAREVEALLRPELARAYRAFHG